MSKPKLRVILGRSPMDSKVMYGDIDLTAALAIQRIYVQPVDANQQDITKVTMTILPDSVEIDADDPTIEIDGQTFTLTPTA